jgi:hypothetical protein
MEILDDAEQEVLLSADALEVLEAACLGAKHTESPSHGEQLSDDKKQFYALSDRLDKLAALVDGVLSADNEVVKQRKKRLSRQIATLMRRADALMPLYAGSP